ncbi:MAG: hypothetical protein ACREXY_20685, partial [Gammaproteobacteria bacterium]
GDDMRLTWTVVGGKTYRVQVSASLNGSFVDLSPLFTTPGASESTTNFVDADALTRTAARFYRIVVR